MEDIEQLAMGTTSVAAITPKLIADSLQEVARKKVIWAQLFTPVDISGQTGLSIEFPVEGSGISFDWNVTEGSAAAESSMDYTAVTIRVKKLGGYVPITREAIQSGIRDVIKDEIYQAGLVYKETIDTIAYEALLGVTSGGPLTIAAAAGKQQHTLTGGSYPILELSSVGVGTANTLVTCDYKKGIVYFAATLAAAATITYKYAATATVSTHGIAVSTSSSGSVSARGIAIGRAEMIGRGRNPTFAVVKDSDFPNLIYDPAVKFLDASAYGGREPLLNAEIGKVFNQRVLTTSRELSNGVVILVDKDRAGKWVTKRPLEAHREDKWEYDTVRYYLWSQFNFGVTDAQAICIVPFGTTTYPDTYPAA